MFNNHNEDAKTGQIDGRRHNRRKRRLLARLFRDRSGTSAIEFALLALPFMMVVFASLETFTAFTAEQLLANATDTMARKVRTGEITSAMTREEFRTAFCAEISIIMTCSATEAKTPSKLYIDVQNYADFSKIPAAIPRKNGELDTDSFQFKLGGPATVTVVRAYYRWEVITDLVRPYITNLRSPGKSMPNDYLMVATTAFRTESY